MVAFKPCLRFILSQLLSEYCMYMYVQETQTVSLCVEQLSHNLNRHSSFPENELTS